MCRSRFVPVILLLLASMAAGQVPSVPCSITPIRPSREANMFTPAQEVDLGEVPVEIVRDNAKELDDPDLTTYLQQVGDRLASHLPPLGLKYRFYLSNLPTANAFSIAGGRVYVTRKLIGFARSEDELAGVMAHELGHIVTHSPLSSTPGSSMPSALPRSKIKRILKRNSIASWKAARRSR